MSNQNQRKLFEPALSLTRERLREEIGRRDGFDAAMMRGAKR